MKTVTRIALVTLAALTLGILPACAATAGTLAISTDPSTLSCGPAGQAHPTDGNLYVCGPVDQADPSHPRAICNVGDLYYWAIARHTCGYIAKAKHHVKHHHR